MIYSDQSRNSVANIGTLEIQCLVALLFIGTLEFQSEVNIKSRVLGVFYKPPTQALQALELGTGDGLGA